MKKIKFIYFYFFIIALMCTTKIYSLIKSNNLIEKIIVIDPGHGGKDSGAVYENIYEKDINLIISKKLQKELTSRGAIVYLTREEDKDLSTSNTNRKRQDLYNRAIYINNINPDLYISIHLNYIENSKWKGLQIFYNNINKENKNISTILTNYLKENMPNVRNQKQDNTYLMYKYIKSPGVLIELGFLSNPIDRYNLTNNNYQDTIVNIISNSIEYYYTK